MLRHIGMTAGLVCALSICANFAAAQGTETASILVYNAQHVSLTQEWIAGFTKETGIRAVLRNGSDMELANQIVQEGAASPADIFLTENSPGISLVDHAGLLAPVNGDTLSEVPAEFRPSDGRWVGIAARSTVFAYNRDSLSETDLPKSLLDLAGAKWKGRWGASPNGADFQAIVSALLDLRGEAVAADWLKAMKANAITFNGNTAALKAVNAAQIDGVVIYHYYYFGDQAKTGENSNHTLLHYFRHEDPGAFLSLSGGGVLASSRRQAQAQAFLKYVAGPAGQAVLRTGTSYEYAVGNGAASNPKLVPIAELEAPKLDPSKLNSQKVIDLMIAAGLL